VVPRLATLVATSHGVHVTGIDAGTGPLQACEHLSRDRVSLVVVQETGPIQRGY
jgi:hypothetical protein